MKYIKTFEESLNNLTIDDFQIGSYFYIKDKGEILIKITNIIIDIYYYVIFVDIEEFKIIGDDTLFIQREQIEEWLKRNIVRFATNDEIKLFDEIVNISTEISKFNI